MNNRKNVVITGASSGIGLAIAQRLAKEGFALFLGARRLDRLESLAENLSQEYSVDVSYAPLDVSKPESIQTFFEAVDASYETLHALVNNAGMARGVEYLEAAKDSDWLAMMDVNFHGAMRMSQEALKRMKDHNGCRVLNIASIAGREAYEGGGGYCASKAAMKSMSRSLRLELLDRGIGVSTIDPGLVETEFSVARLGDEVQAKKVYKGLMPLIGEDIASAAAYILTQPDHVNVDEILITPVAQGYTKRTIRKTD